jgi:hypothetical protein
VGSDGAQLAHDLSMHGTDFGVDFRRQLNISGDGFLDTKTSAMNRHEKFPDPLLRRALKQTEFNMRFTPELAWASFGNAAH